MKEEYQWVDVCKFLEHVRTHRARGRLDWIQDGDNSGGQMPVCGLN